MKTNVPLLSYLAYLFLEWEMFKTKFVEKIKKHFFPRKSCCVWENVEKYCRAEQATNDHMAYGHCKYTQWCVMLIAFPQQQWLHERTSVLRYTYIACLVIFC